MQGSELEVSYTGNLGRLYLGHETGLKDTNGRKRKEEKGNLYRTSIYISCFVKVGVENSKLLSSRLILLSQVSKVGIDLTIYVRIELSCRNRQSEE